jgi:hypothetical protein
MTEPSAPPRPKGYWSRRGWLLLIAVAQFLGVNGATFLILFIGKKMNTFFEPSWIGGLVIATFLTTPVLCVAILLPACLRFVRAGLCLVAAALTGYLAIEWAMDTMTVLAGVLIALAYAVAGLIQLLVGVRLALEKDDAPSLPAKP